MSLADDLRAARALIEAPAQWCQGSYAQDATGRAVSRFAAGTTRYCALGAIERAVFVPGDDATVERMCAARDAVLESAGAEFNMPVWNDERGRTHVEVLAAFDAAIADAEMFA